MSLDVGHSTVFLVIKNEKVMSNFIKLLIHSLKTVDGKKGSAIQIHAQLVESEVNKMKQTWRNKEFNQDTLDKISKRCWH
jgi:hypothetical protein